MKRKEKVRERDKKRGELMVGKLELRVLVGRRERNSTPSPIWKFGFIQPDGSLIQDYTNKFPINSSSLSARKLAANLWEIQPHLRLKMSKNGFNLGRAEEEKPSYGLEKQKDEAPLDGPSHQMRGIISRKKVEEEAMHHNERIRSVGDAQQPLLPASLSGSIGKSATSSSSPMVSRGKLEESSYRIKSSTELLKLLNRIWKLEEKHALDMSLLKTLRSELDQAQTRIKELLQEKKRDQKAIDNLIGQINEEKTTRKSKSQDRIETAVKFAREELKDERKLRRRAEKLYHKLADEILELKSLFSDSLTELARETKDRRLLEDLCGVFAKEVLNSEQEMRLMKYRSCEDVEGGHRLVLHIAESWLDEQTQVKLQDTGKTSSILDKLSVEIETFLREKQSKDLEKNGFPSPEKNNSRKARMQSLESLHLNDPGSGPWNGNDEDDSVTADIPFHKGTSSKLDSGKGKNIIADGTFKETTRAKVMKSRKEVEGSDQLETEHADVNETNPPRRLSKNEVFQRTSNKKVQHDGNYYTEGYFNTSTFAGPPSPVKKWVSDIWSTDPNTYQSPSRWPQNSKPDTLKAKLLEARLESQKSRSIESKLFSQVD